MISSPPSLYCSLSLFLIPIARSIFIENDCTRIEA